MAKRNDLANQAIELCPGLVIDTKIKIGAIWQLEDKYDKPIGQIKFDSGRMRDVGNLIIALAMQHDPKLTEEQAKELIKQLEPEQLATVMEKLGSAFEVKLKNSPRPALKPPVKGNLMQ